MSDLVTKDTPSILDSEDMVGEAKQIIDAVPAADIEGMHSPEELAEARNTFWKAYLTNGTELQEGNFNIGSFLKNYIQTHGNADLDGIIAALPDEKAGLYYKTHTDALQQKVNEMVAKLGAQGTPVNAEPPKPFSVDDLTNDLAKELAGSEDEVNAVLTAADSAQDKFDTIRSVARTILQGKGIKHHAFIYGDPGCGKTFSVKEAMKYDFPKGPLARKGYSIEFNAGDIGKAASAIVAFFYKNRNKKVIILDDCDSFVLSKDQAIQNLLKGMLDLDNTEKNPKMITVAPQIRKLASKIIAADNEALEEGVEVEINQNALREGRLAVSVNGEEVYNEEASAEDLAQFKLVEAAPAKKAIREHTDYSGLGLLFEGTGDDDEWEDMSEDDAEVAAQFAELDNEDPEQIPPKWRFASRLIMISNLKKTDLNDAVLSRTLSYELRLTQEEFMARLAQILPHMLTDVETEDSAEVVNYAKEAAYAYLLAAVELANKGGSVGGKPVRIVGKLQFRIIAELAGKWMQRADDYASKNNIDVSDRLAMDRINNAIKRKFFMYDVMPSLIID